MSESLVPFIHGGEGRRPVIVVDSREASAAPKVLKGLREADVDIRIVALPRGDYIISDRVAIERKTVKDFVYTLTRRHLFEQIFTLKEYYQLPLLLIEGYMPIVYKFSRIKPASIWGAMFSLAKGGIYMIHTTNYKETVDFLVAAAKQEQFLEGRKPKVHPIKKFKSLADAQIFFLSSLPNIGYEKAVSLLRRYQTPMNALLNVENWAEAVHGLGPKIVEKAKEVLNTPYGGEGDEGGDKEN